MKNYPSPVRGVFCISIVDHISKSALVLFNLLRPNKHHKKRVLLKLSSLGSKLYREDYWLLSFYSNNREGEWFVIVFILFLWDRTKKGYIMCYYPLTYYDYVISDIVYITLSCILVLFTNIEYVISWYFLSQLLKKSKDSINLYFRFSSAATFKDTKFLLPLLVSGNWT